MQADVAEAPPPLGSNDSISLLIAACDIIYHILQFFSFNVDFFSLGSA